MQMDFTTAMRAKTMTKITTTRRDVCDNCGGECSGITYDKTLIAITTLEDRPFQWGKDCECGTARALRKSGAKFYE
jgi:hypothetical protein